jgi:hypothetical protein
MRTESASYRSSGRCLILSLLGLLILLLAGCPGSDSAPEVYDPVNWQGNVDPEAPDEVQQMQQALIRLFTAIQQVGVDHVTEEEPDIQFREPFSEFFEDDTVDLYRWDWDGPPNGNRFPVVLILRKDEPGFPEVEKRRAYAVSRSGRTYVVQRSE